MDHSLIEQYQQSEERNILEKIILKYTYLIKSQVDKMSYGMPASLTKDDLISFGVIGLIDAVKKFDPSQNVPFTAYARIRIRGAILDGLRNFDFVPRKIRDEVRNLHRAYQALESELGRSPDNSELAEKLSVSEADIDKLWQEATWAIPTYLSDFVFSEEEQLRLEDVFPNDKSPDPLEEVQKEDIKAKLGQAIDALPEKEKLVLSLYYYEELNLKEIAEIMELSESRISQLHSKGIMRLRGKLTIQKRMYNL